MPETPAVRKQQLEGSACSSLNTKSTRTERAHAHAACVDLESTLGAGTAVQLLLWLGRPAQLKACLPGAKGC